MCSARCAWMLVEIHEYLGRVVWIEERQDGDLYPNFIARDSDMLTDPRRVLDYR